MILQLLMVVTLQGHLGDLAASDGKSFYFANHLMRGQEEVTEISRISSSGELLSKKAVEGHCTVTPSGGAVSFPSDADQYDQFGRFDVLKIGDKYEVRRDGIALWRKPCNVNDSVRINPFSGDVWVIQSNSEELPVHRYRLGTGALLGQSVFRFPSSMPAQPFLLDRSLCFLSADKAFVWLQKDGPPIPTGGSTTVHTINLSLLEASKGLVHTLCGFTLRWDRSSELPQPRTQSIIRFRKDSLAVYWENKLFILAVK